MFAWFLVPLWMVALAGCSMVFQGHALDSKKIASLELGVTTEAELTKLLGAPESIVRKRAEGKRIYQYKYLRGFAVALPFAVSVGRTNQSGRVLNVVVQDGKVVDYEDTQINEPFFYR